MGWQESGSSDGSFASATIKQVPTGDLSSQRDVETIQGLWGEWSVPVASCEHVQTYVYV